MGVVTVADRNGTLLSSLGLTIGSSVSIKIVDHVENRKQDSPELSLGNMVILQIIADDSLNPATLGGNVSFVLVHPWLIHTFYTDRAFGDVAVSEIIKQTAQNAIDLGLISLSDNFQDSNPGNGVFRYRCNISDVDYIEKKCLPLCVKNKQPMFAFLNESNQLVLDTFSHLYETQKPKLALFSDLNAIDQTSSKLGLPSTCTQLAGCEDTKVFIGGESDKEALLLRHHVRSMEYDAGQGTSEINVIGSAYTANDRRFPIAKEVGASAPYSNLTVQNMPYGDLLNYVAWATKSMYKLSSVQTSIVCQDELKLGSVVHFYAVNPDVKTMDTKAHWTVSNRLISQITYYSTGGSDAHAHLVLSLPTIAKDKTAVTNTKLLAI